MTAEEKLIYVCLVCASNNIIQDTRPTTEPNCVAILHGCHCGDCGVKYAFNKGSRPNS